ncbi:SURF1 family protein [Brachybacterium sp. FME24]|uniref:SURF1 family protein n=1 Tax=Brachybacterium sp. FME24 TaxID=2742605 RepID=UPI001865F591|nr:SURF1 family protein [Brachybacterium sp. FME24]
MLRVALRPHFLGLLALMVVATIVCGLLATWQWERAHHALADKAAGAEQLGDIRDVVGIGDPVTNAVVGDIVTATGQYAADEQIIVPGRLIDGEEAVIIVASLHLDLEDGTEARLPVARGWVPADEITGPDGELDPALAPPLPSGEVEVSGRLEASESAAGGIDGGIAGEIATTLLVNVWGSPMYSGYLAQVDPTGALEPMPEAQSEFSKGLDWQNIGYSLQWVLFGGFFLYLWWRSVRTAHLDELAERREAMQESLEGPGPAEGTARPDDDTVHPADDSGLTAVAASSSPASVQAGSTPEKDV